MATLTSANSSFVISATQVYPAPQPLQGYAADDAFTLDALDLAETVMGVDGKLSAGYTPNPTNVNITIQADSPSVETFDLLISAMKTTREIVWIDAVVQLPSTGAKYVLTRGVLKNANQMPDAKKILQPQKYVITFESVTKSVI